MESTTHLVVPAIVDTTISDADVGKMTNMPYENVALASGLSVKVCRVGEKGLLPEHEIFFTEEVSALKFVPLHDTGLDILFLQFCSGSLSYVYLHNGKLVTVELLKYKEGVEVKEGTLFLDTCRSKSMIAVTCFGNLYRYQFSSNSYSRRQCLLPIQTPMRDIKMTSSGDLAVLQEYEGVMYIHLGHFPRDVGVNWNYCKLKCHAYGFVRTPMNYTSLMLFGDGRVVIVSPDLAQNVLVVNSPFSRFSAGLMLPSDDSSMKLILTGPHGQQNLVRIVDDPSRGLTPFSIILGYTCQTWKLIPLHNSRLLNVSRTGDSKFYEFNEELSTLDSTQVILSRAPIQDMALLRVGEKRTVVVVSGEGVDSSLRLLSAFYRIKAQKTIPILNVKRVFSMQLKWSTGFVNFLLCSTAEKTTALFAITNKDDVEKVVVCGEGTFNSAPTIAAQLLLDQDQTILQVCSNAIKVMKKVADGKWTITGCELSIPILQAHIHKSGKVLVTVTADGRLEVFSLTKKPNGVVPEPVACNRFQLPISSVTTVNQEAILESHSAPTHLLIAFANFKKIAVMTLPKMEMLFAIETDIVNPTSLCVVGKTLVITGSDGKLAYSSTLDVKSKSTGLIRYDTSRIHGMATTIESDIIVAGVRPVIISRKNQGLSFCDVDMPFESASVFDGSATMAIMRFVVSSNDRMQIVDIERKDYTIHLREVCKSVAFSKDIDVLAVGLHRVATGPMADFKTASCLDEDLISHSGIKNGRQPEYDSLPADYYSSVLFFHVPTLHRLHVHKYGIHEVVLRVLPVRIEGFETQLFCAVSHLDYCARARIVIFRLVVEDKLTTSRIAAEYEFEGTPSNVEIDGQWIFISSGQDLMTFQLVFSGGKFGILSHQSVKQEETIEEMQTDGQHVLIAGKSSSTEYILSDTNQLEKVNKWLLPACKMIFHNGIYMRVSDVHKVIQKYIIPLRARDQPSPILQESNYYLGMTPSQLMMTPSDMNHQCLMEHQFIYGTTAGHLGWGLSLKPKWAVLLKRAVDCLLTSEYFKSRIESQLPIVNKRKEYEAKSFIDGHVFVLLLKMKDEDCMLALESMTFEGSTPGMPTNKEEFLKFLCDLLQMTVLSCNENYRR